MRHRARVGRWAASYLVEVALISMSALGCDGTTTSSTELPPPPPSEAGATGDVDPSTYQTVQIGNLEWMAENLATVVSTDGASLTGVWVYADQESNAAEHGRLYDWEAARRACPAGWRLPTNADWLNLEAAVGENAGTKLKLGGSSGFDAKMSGLRLDDRFEFLGQVAVFWSADESGDGTHAICRRLSPNSPDLSFDNNETDFGLSVRCVSG